MSYDEPDQLDMKVLGFLTTDRLDGDWNSLLFEIRNHEFEEEDSDSELELCPCCGEEWTAYTRCDCPNEWEEEDLN